MRQWLFGRFASERLLPLLCAWVFVRRSPLLLLSFSCRVLPLAGAALLAAVVIVHLLRHVAIVDVVLVNDFQMFDRFGRLAGFFEVVGEILSDLLFLVVIVELFFYRVFIYAGFQI